jgi:hypothetical protein
MAFRHQARAPFGGTCPESTNNVEMGTPYRRNQEKGRRTGPPMVNPGFYNAAS